MRDDRGLLEAFLGDGRVPLATTGLILLLRGWFAIFQSSTGYFLPQDVQALGFDARQLAIAANIRVVHFMATSIPGAVLRRCSFCRSFWRVYGPHARPLCPLSDVWLRGQPMSPGRLGLGFLGVGMLIAGATIMVVGMTRLRDLTFMCVTPAELNRISARLVPVIAHDRAGFGSGLFSTGIILFFLARHALSRSLIQTIAFMGLVGFGSAIGAHPAIGYTNFTRPASAYFGALILEPPCCV